ncbi:MAG: hypothetical protein JJE30_18615 [Desulfuromonadales bacterium]|nr:hypothetical protein [Desulfuromonadales bacterium]
MKSFAYVLILAAIGMSIVLVQPVSAREPNQSRKLIGSWSLTLNSPDSDMSQCPYVPDAMEFFADQTMIISNYGDRHLPFKTSLTKLERRMIEERNPGLKGKNLLLILPAPNLTWAYTPLTYAYAIDNNELTLTFSGWLPVTFKRVTK